MALVEADRIKETTATTGTGNVTLAGAATGYRAFASVMANSDTCVYCINLGAEWEVGIGTFVSATPALARTTILASSNAGAAVPFSAGSKDVFITRAAERFMLPQRTDDPAAPGSGVFMYTRPLAGKHIPRWIGPSGLDTACQPSLWGDAIKMWLPGTGTTAPINFGTTWTVNTTQSHPTIANTNFMTQMTRAVFTSTTTAANTTGIRSSVVAWRGNAAGQGGFFFAARFGITTYTATMRMIVGLAERAAAFASEPNLISNFCGLGKHTSETSWVIVTTTAAGGTSFTKTPTGKVTASAGASAVLDFYMFCKPNDTKITFSLCDITDNTWSVANVDVSTTLPDNTIMLTAHIAAQNVTGGAGSAVAMFLSRVYLASDN